MMADYFSQLAFLRDLFSIRAGGGSTYAYQSLRPIVPGANELLKRDYEAGLKQLCAAADATGTRRNSILDLLLSLYAQHIRAPELSAADQGGSAGRDAAVIRAKQTLLTRMTAATRDRGRGFDYRRPGSQNGMAGVELLSRIKLGLLNEVTATETIDQETTAGQTNIGETNIGETNIGETNIGETNIGETPVQSGRAAARDAPIAVRHRSDASFGHPLSHETSSASGRLFRIIEDNEDDFDLPPPSGHSPLAGHFVATALLATLDDPGCYRLRSMHDSGHTDLVCIDIAGNWWVLGRYQTEKEALAVRRDLVEAARRLRHRGQSKQFFIVEWLLLRHGRSAAVAAGRYNFRITAVLSATPAESESAAWRNEARKILQANTPAHIQLECLFLGHARMEHFQRLYQAWTRALRRGLPHQLSRTSRKLQRFLFRQGPPPDIHVGAASVRAAPLRAAAVASAVWAAAIPIPRSGSTTPYRNLAGTSSGRGRCRSGNTPTRGTGNRRRGPTGARTWHRRRPTPPHRYRYRIKHPPGRRSRRGGNDGSASGLPPAHHQQPVSRRRRPRHTTRQRRRPTPPHRHRYRIKRPPGRRSRRGGNDGSARGLPPAHHQRPVFGRRRQRHLKDHNWRRYRLQRRRMGQSSAHPALNPHRASPHRATYRQPNPRRARMGLIRPNRRGSIQHPTGAETVAPSVAASVPRAPRMANRANLSGFRRRRQSQAAPAASAPAPGQATPGETTSGQTTSGQTTRGQRTSGQPTAAAPGSTATLSGTVKAAPPGALGFDTDTTLTASTAQAFLASGATFAVRYLSRTTPEASGDLSATEAKDILAAGLALMAVQHVSQSGWTPSESLGTQLGNAAAANAGQVGLPKGVVLWLDLEGVASGTEANAITDYCNAWFASVSAAGYLPGTYIGANCGLTGDQIYYGLLCEYYWQAGGSVPAIPVLGYCMVQTISSSFVLDGVAYDRDTIQADDVGSTPIWLAPTGAIA